MKLTTWVMKPMLQSAAMGAEPTLMAATLPQARPGAYYGPGGLFKLRGHPIEAQTTSFAHDAAAAEILFQQLEEITGVRYPF